MSEIVECEFGECLGKRIGLEGGLCASGCILTLVGHGRRQDDASNLC